MRKTINTRIGIELYNKRKMDKELLSNALRGLRISDVDLDRIYTKELQKLDIRKLLRGIN